MTECIQVVVRCRPLNQREKDEKSDKCVEIFDSRQISIRNPQALQNEIPKNFTYDLVFDENSLQKVFYEEACFPLIESVLEGFNATIFAYGQTGSGKSHTMQGDISSPELRGVIPNSFSHIFEFIRGSKDIQFLLRCSYLEIYNEEIRDLLVSSAKAHSNIKYDIRDDPVKGVYVQNLTNVMVETEEQMIQQFERGLLLRTVAETQMNDKSSRSHSIFTVIIEMSTKDEAGNEHVKAGKLNLVDLAGSERQKKTGAVGKVLKEGAKINLSLLSLGCVISALADGKSQHIKYRDSKLTRLLQDSLGGNTKTCMVAAISPADSNYDETLSTLRYANNAKNIQNKPRVNEDPKDTMIREFREEIERLKKLLMSQSQIPPEVIASLMKDGSVAAMPTSPRLVPKKSDSPQHDLLGSTADEASTDTTQAVETVTRTVNNENPDTIEVEQFTANSSGTLSSKPGIAIDAATEGESVNTANVPVESAAGFSQLTLEVQELNVGKSNDLGLSSNETESASSAPTSSSPNSESSTIIAAINNAIEAVIAVEIGSTEEYAHDSLNSESSQIQSQLSQDGGAEESYLSSNISFPSTDVLAAADTDKPSITIDSSTAVANNSSLPTEPTRPTLTEAEIEARIREEIALRLIELQSKFVDSIGTANTAPAVPMAPIDPASNNVGSLEEDASEESNKEAENAQAEIAAAEIRRLEAEKIHKERKLKASKRRERQQQEELIYVLEEKRAIEDELDELRQSLATATLALSTSTTTAEGTSNEIEKKVTKMRKKVEKKYQAEIDDLKEDFEYQREQLLDAIKDAERSAKLYRTICSAVLSEADLQKIVDFAQYNEEDDEWIIPQIKVKSVEIRTNNKSSRPASYVRSPVNVTSDTSSSSYLPNVNRKQSPGVSSSANNNGFTSFLPTVPNTNSSAVSREGSAPRRRASNHSPVYAPPINSTIQQQAHSQERTISPNDYLSASLPNLAVNLPSQTVNSSNYGSSGLPAQLPTATKTGRIPSAKQVRNAAIIEAGAGIAYRPDSSSNNVGMPVINRNINGQVTGKKSQPGNNNEVDYSMPVLNQSSALPFQIVQQMQPHFSLPSAFSPPTDGYGMEGGGVDEEKQELKKKNKKKKVKADNVQSVSSDTDASQSDQYGDGVTSGPLSDWGFADISQDGRYKEGQMPSISDIANKGVKKTTKSKNSSGFGTDSGGEEYLDDEFENEEELKIPDIYGNVSGQGKKKRQVGNNNTNKATTKKKKGSVSSASVDEGSYDSVGDNNGLPVVSVRGSYPTVASSYPSGVSGQPSSFLPQLI